MVARHKPSIAILHYSCPPVIGGVEFIIEAHARLFAERGHPVRLVVGRGGRVHPRVRTVTAPPLASDGGPHAAVVAALAKGRVPDAMEAAVVDTVRTLKRALRGVDVCMIHNVLTMHFNLVLTAALARIMADDPGRTQWVGWTHDLTFKEPVYQAHQHDRYPWNLMKTALPGCRYCAISRDRARHMERLFGLARVPVIPDGIDVPRLLGLTPMAADLYRREDVARREIVALTPARVLRRKNFETGIAIVAALKRRQVSLRWFITGAPDPHHPDARRYGRMLKGMIRREGLRHEIVFLGERYAEPVSDDDLRGLFAMADVLLFPSTREGFGLPVLEGGLARLLLVLNDIPVFRELKGGDAIMLKPQGDMDALAGRILARLARRPEMAYRKRIMAEYGWDHLFEQRILPAAVTPAAVWG